MTLHALHKGRFELRLDQSSMDISTLVDKIQRNEIDIQPNFQRGQVWSDAKKRRLIDTILRDWYIPAIHIVVNDDLDKEEVLDGQQRLRAIIDFMADKFPIDGYLAPEDEFVVALDGLYYSELPPRVRSRFRKFPINTVRLRDYRSAEPGELFFRLNQLTALTAAEQRNALVGEPRNQIKLLVEKLELGVGSRTIGFSNARMNYDDTLSRLAVVLETGHLQEKLTARSLERRYRDGAGFSSRVISRISRATEFLSHVFSDPNTHSRLNRASLFSWLFFFVDYDVREHSNYADFFVDFYQSFEVARSVSSYTHTLISQIDTDLYETISGSPSAREAIRIFNDRSSSRVNDVSSVLLRDMCLNVVFDLVAPRVIKAEFLVGDRAASVSELRMQLGSFPDDLAERALVESSLAKRWEAGREAG